MHHSIVDAAVCRRAAIQTASKEPESRHTKESLRREKLVAGMPRWATVQRALSPRDTSSQCASCSGKVCPFQRETSMLLTCRDASLSNCPATTDLEDADGPELITPIALFCHRSSTAFDPVHRGTQIRHDCDLDMVAEIVGNANRSKAPATSQRNPASSAACRCTSRTSFA